MTLPKREASRAGVAWREIAARWRELTPDVCTRWPKLTYMEALRVSGQRDRLCRLLCERYDVSFDDADDMVARWQADLERQVLIEAV